MTIVGCPDEETVQQFLSGGLPQEASRDFEAHVDGCARCQRRLIEGLGRWSASRAARSMGQPAVAPGPVLTGDRYVIREEAAPGKTCAAYDSLLDRKVTLRFLDPSGQARAMGDATAMARLSHPNVATVHDVGVQGGVPYLATERVEGVTLAAWRQQGEIGARRIAQVMAAAARGLAAAHSAGVVHGNVGPDSILVAEPRVVVTDFGVPSPLRYPPPERSRGEPADQRADVFAFCATLYEMIHGKPPPPAAADGPVPPSRPLARLHRLALRGLHPDPAQRLASLDRLADEIGAPPGARLRRTAVAATAAAAVAAAFWGGGHLTASPERKCRAGAGAIAGAWNDGRRAQLRQHYLAAGLVPAGWPALERMLDGYADGWRGMYGQTCAQSFGKREQTDQVLDLRIDCLEARRAVLDAFVGVLASATPQQLLKAPSAVLPEVADCGIAGRLQTKPLPQDPQARAQVAEIEKLVARAQADQNLGEYHRADATAAQAVEAARKLGYEPLLASALVRQASIGAGAGGSGDQGKTTGLDRAAKLFEEAYAVAERGRDDRLRLLAAREQVMLQGRRQTYAEGERWARLGEGLLARLGNPPLDASVLAGNAGYLQKFQGRLPEAAAAFRRSLELAQKIVPADPRRVVAAQGGICSVTEDVRERIACSRRLVEMARQAYGPEHPDLATHYAILAEGLVLQKETRGEACALFRKSLAILERTVERAHPNTIAVLSELAQCLVQEGQVAESLHLLDEVIARKPGPADLGYAFDSVGFIQLRYGDLGSSLRNMRTALATLQQAFEPANDNLMYSRANLTEVLIHAGQTAEAQRVVQEGLDAARKAGVMTGQIADLRAQQGAALLVENRHQPALRAFEDALRLHRTAKSPEDKLAYTLHGVGAALLGLGRTDGARGTLERAFAVRPESSMIEGELRADIGLDLARALPPRDRQRACDLAREAAGIYRSFHNVQRKLRETERWLARNRCTVQA